MRLSLRPLLLCALFTALMVICSQLVIPLPMVPISMALLAVYLTGAILGPRLGAVSMGVYALLGLVGVPVFASFGAGPGILFGKTGGYVLGYILAAFLTGLLTRKRTDYGTMCLAMALGTLACYAFGTAWFMAVTGLDLWTSLGYCVLPFIPGDAVKILMAAFLAKRLRPQVERMLA
ncbi:MAG: biotin transporter BioY [Clostridia bacterium]|nr:biotin transporter BioY [Candidatus Pelethousia sp.]NCB29910.1 biotin transporter BioY [Clostridia bacterium]